MASKCFNAALFVAISVTLIVSGGLAVWGGILIIEVGWSDADLFLQVATSALGGLATGTLVMLVTMIVYWCVYWHSRRRRRRRRRVGLRFDGHIENPCSIDDIPLVLTTMTPTPTPDSDAVGQSDFTDDRVQQEPLDWQESTTITAGDLLSLERSLMGNMTAPRPVSDEKPKPTYAASRLAKFRAQMGDPVHGTPMGSPFVSSDEEQGSALESLRSLDDDSADELGSSDSSASEKFNYEEESVRASWGEDIRSFPPPVLSAIKERAK